MMLDGQRIDPIAFARLMREKVAASGLSGNVPAWGPQFGIRTGSPEEWARFWTMVQQQESGHRIAQVNPDGTLQRFRTTPAGERSFGPGQFNVGEYGLKTWADVNDPNKVADAYINVAKANKVPAYFGSVQRPHKTMQHGGWYDKTVAPHMNGLTAYGEDSWLDPGSAQQAKPSPVAAPSAPQQDAGINRLLELAKNKQKQDGMNELAGMFQNIGKQQQAPSPQFGYSPMPIDLRRFTRV